jgi:hypothetical protein
MGTPLGLRPNAWLFWEPLRSTIGPEPFLIKHEA